MLRRLNEIAGYKVIASDGIAGIVEDLLVDRTGWVVRYLVVDAGEWLKDRKVLIYPAVLQQPDWAGRSLAVNLSLEQIRESPELSPGKPILRRYESLLHEHYGWHPYWLAKVPGSRPVGPTMQTDIPPELPESESSGDKVETSDASSHLWSARSVNDYELKTADGEYGQVFDVLVDDEYWSVRYLCVRLRRIVPEKALLVPHSIAREIDWNRSRITVDASTETFIRAPEYNASRPVSSDYESALMEYYEHMESGA